MKTCFQLFHVQFSVSKNSAETCRTFCWKLFVHSMLVTNLLKARFLICLGCSELCWIHKVNLESPLNLKMEGERANHKKVLEEINACNTNANFWSELYVEPFLRVIPPRS